MTSSYFRTLLTTLQCRRQLNTGARWHLCQERSSSAALGQQFYDAAKAAASNPIRNAQPIPGNEFAFPRQDAREGTRKLVAQNVKGVVDWFHVKKGHGFIRRHDDGPDVFVHFTGIERKNPAHLLRTLAHEEEVEFDVEEGEKGDEAVRVRGPNGTPVKGHPLAENRGFLDRIGCRETTSHVYNTPINNNQNQNRYWPRRNNTAPPQQNLNNNPAPNPIRFYPVQTNPIDALKQAAAFRRSTNVNTPPPIVQMDTWRADRNTMSDDVKFDVWEADVKNVTDGSGPQQS